MMCSLEQRLNNTNRACDLPPKSSSKFSLLTFSDLRLSVEVFGLGTITSEITSNKELTKYVGDTHAILANVKQRARVGLGLHVHLVDATLQS